MADKSLKGYQGLFLDDETNGVKGKAVNTGTLKFEPIEETIEIVGKLGYFVLEKKKLWIIVFLRRKRKWKQTQLTLHN